MKILVTGATGTVGGHVARLLSGRGHKVLALVRDPARATLPADVEILAGDLTSARDLAEALPGVQRAFLNMADDNGATFAPAAAAAGLDHVVLLSSFAAVTDLPLGENNIITARHRAGERALDDAGVPATFLRAAGFDDNFLMWASDIGAGVVRSPHPDTRLPVVDPEDIAEAAVAVLLSEAPAGGAYSITGPQALSVREQTAVVSQVVGRTLVLETVSERAARAAAFPEDTPNVVVESVLGTLGDAASALPVSSDVELLTGRPARTFEQWSVEHKAALQ